MLVLRFLIEVSNPTSGITTCLLPKETKNRNSNYKKQVLFKDTILVTSNPVALGKRRNNSGTMKHVSFLCWRLERPLYQHSFQKRDIFIILQGALKCHTSSKGNEHTAGNMRLCIFYHSLDNACFIYSRPGFPFEKFQCTLWRLLR